MPNHHYTAEEKALVFKALIENLGDTQAAAEATGINERTVQRWKTKFKPKTVLTRNELDAELKAISITYAHQARRLQLFTDNIITKMELYPDSVIDLSLPLVRIIDRCFKLHNLANNSGFNIIILWQDHNGEILGDLIPDDNREIFQQLFPDADEHNTPF